MLLISRTDFCGYAFVQSMACFRSYPMYTNRSSNSCTRLLTQGTPAATCWYLRPKVTWNSESPGAATSCLVAMSVESFHAATVTRCPSFSPSASADRQWVACISTRVQPRCANLLDCLDRIFGGSTTWMEILLVWGLPSIVEWKHLTIRLLTLNAGRHETSLTSRFADLHNCQS
jgi:hypothetical protein